MSGLGQLFTLLDGLIVHVSRQQVWYDTAVKTVMKQTELRLILKEAHRLLTDRLLVELGSHIQLVLCCRAA